MTAPAFFDIPLQQAPDSPKSASRSPASPSTPDVPRFMNSTWHIREQTLRNPLAWLAYTLMYKGRQEKRAGKVPVLSGWVSRKFPLLDRSAWTDHLSDAFMIPRAFLSLLLIPFIISYLAPHLPSFISTYRPVLPVLFFTTVYNFTGINMLLLINRLAETYGFFDGNVKRDVIPDARLNETMLGVVVLTVMRPVVGTFMLWNEWEAKGGASGWDSAHWGWWALGLPFRLFLSSVVMDFWF